jgi:hypothetical protein
MLPDAPNPPPQRKAALGGRLPEKAGSQFPPETSHDLKKTLPPDLAAALEGLRRAMEIADNAN